MRITVFGASGRTGRSIVEQALERRHQVRAFVHANRLDGCPGLQVVRGDVLEIKDVEIAVAGQDAVLSALGNSHGLVCSVGTKNIVDAMNRTGVRRLVVESAYGAGDSAKEISALDRLVVRGVLLRGPFRDKDAMEACVEGSGLAWTIVRPPRLTGGPPRGGYRAGERIPLRIASGIPRADVAGFMLEQLEGDEFVGKKPSITAG